MRFHWLLSSLVFAAILAIANKVAITNYLYWHYLWLDTPMHALGGIVIGVLVVALLGDRRPVAFLALCAAAFIGWEIFEYIAKVPQSPNYFFDTTKDLLMDTLGAVAVYVVARKTLWR
jgi:hypothetical protein